MKRVFRLLGIIAVMAVIGFALGGCPTATGGDGGSDIPAELVAKWYIDANNNGTVDAAEKTTAAYEFKADGKLVVAGTDAGLTFTVSGDKITLVSGGTAAAESITFKINGKKLTLTGSTASGFVAGTYVKE
jgi:hypothetical protein